MLRSRGHGGIGRLIGLHTFRTDIKFFGCICYALVLLSEHKHLLPRAQCGVFVGVDEWRRGYRVVRDRMRTCIVAQSVTFDEQSL